MLAVPNTIYYCWFGRGDLPETALRSLRSWESYAPGFEIRRCDEDVFDVHSCAWTRWAYEAKKYAFVADYVRFRMLYDHGGVYMDLGSELIKDISSLVEACSPFSAIEEASRTVSAGLIIAAPPRDPVIASVLSRYESMSFMDDSAFLSSHTVNEILTAELETRGFTREDKVQRVGNWTILPSSAFNPVYGLGGYHVTKETYSVHRYTGSWTEPKIQIKKRIVNTYAPFLGRRAAQILGRIVGEFRTNDAPRALGNLLGVARDKVEKNRKDE